jgi:Fe2+ or Zn2+ uptake regulation protein
MLMAGTDSAASFVESLRPAGSKRSSKRDTIVNVFLRQEGHLTADDLVDLIKKEDQRISRATIYRTLQWMVDAGIARKVDFGKAASASNIPTGTRGTSISFARPAAAHSNSSAPTSSR